ncbi:hypothetical protein UPYG_G00134820 [Umbra pygmaea]|uniref:Uncharacterized protein n=1 Tax=Umbra pygmaea TaxID=75934 RepID=A0ABD0XIY4_UMBPY
MFPSKSYEDYQSWISSGEKGPKARPKPVTPQPSLSSSPGDAPGHGRKVSFFDDVTVYVFDQESPTRELQCPWTDIHRKEANGQSLTPIYRHTPNIMSQSLTPPSSHLNLPPQLSMPGVCSEDNGVNLEWEDDFSLLDSSLKSKMTDHHISTSESSVPSASPMQTSTPPHQRWGHPFSPACSQLRPSSLILTHVTDADLEH